MDDELAKEMKDVRVRYLNAIPMQTTIPQLVLYVRIELPLGFEGELPLDRGRELP